MSGRRDEGYMQLALELADRARGKTSPNPMVGAVIVKDGRIVGEGYHKKAGSPHAEINALRAAGKKAKGAVLYVTLEPCCFFAKTPPCTDLIIKAGIKKVVFAMKDPNPLNNGKGANILKRHGISVKCGILESQARRLNEVFGKYITTGLPFVILKMAESLDGKIAAKTGESRWISSEGSRSLVHKLRRQVDAVMVGANTARIDKPRLKQSKLKIIVRSTTKNGRVNLRQLFKELGARQISSVLVEGGGELAWSLLKERLVDKVLFFIAPKIIGGRDAITSVEGDGVKKISEAIKLRDVTIRKIGEDILLEGYPDRRWDGSG